MTGLMMALCAGLTWMNHQKSKQQQTKKTLLHSLGFRGGKQIQGIDPVAVGCHSLANGVYPGRVRETDSPAVTNTHHRQQL